MAQFCWHNLLNKHYYYLSDNELAKNKLQNWGIKLCPIPVKIEAPVYKQETILLGQNVRKQIGFNMNWGMDVVKNPMFRAVSYFDEKI